MNCPLCIDQILEITLRHGIELDICPKCRGIWLDRGEIDRLLGNDGSTPPPPSAPSIAASRPTDPECQDLARRAGDDERTGKSSRKKGKKRKSLAERIGEALEEVIDEIT